jgi:hypothetical protein
MQITGRRAPALRAALQEVSMNTIKFSNIVGPDVLEVKINGELVQVQAGTGYAVDLKPGDAIDVYVTDPVAASGQFPQDLADASNQGGDGSGE